MRASMPLWAGSSRISWARISNVGMNVHCRGVVLQCRDGRRRLFYPIPAAYNCDIKEASLVFLIMSWPSAYSDITTMAHKDSFSDPHAEHAPRTEHAMRKVILSSFWALEELLPVDL